MKFRTTLILLCVLIAVGIVLVLTQHHESASTTETPTVAGEKLFTLSSGDLAKISFTDDAGETIVIEKTDFKWSLTAPVKGPAEDAAVTTLLSAVTDAEARGRVDAGAATGLDAPTRKVVLTTKQNQTIAFDIGSRSATGEVVYVRRQGQSQADVVTASLADAFDKPLKEWRRAKLLDIGATEMQQLHVASTQPTINLEKQGTEWRMTQPIAEPADAIAVSDLTSAAANLRAEEFVSDSENDAAKYGLDHPVMTVAFSTAGVVVPPATVPSSQPAPVTIKFGRFGDVLKKNVYAEVSTMPGIFKVSTVSMKNFEKAPLDLRDKKLVTIEPASVTSIEITKDQSATTQPSTRPASSATTVLQIRKNEPSAIATSAPATTHAADTEPATSPTQNPLNEATAAATTAPSTASATKPPTTLPSSKWVIAGKNGEPADDAKIDTLLANVHPLRVERFEQSAATAPAIDTYTVTFHVGDKAETIKFINTGPTQPLRGEWNGVQFVASREMIDSFDGDFSKSAARPMSAAPSMMPGMMPPEMP